MYGLQICADVNLEHRCNDVNLFVFQNVKIWLLSAFELNHLREFY